MVRAIVVVMLCLVSTWSSWAQQIVPELESERKYITFSQAAPLIFAAAVKRANPRTNDQAATAEISYNRALQYAKQIGQKINADMGGNAFSYMSFVPYLAGSKIYGETLTYTFSYGSMSAVSERQVGSFYYKMRQQYSTPFTTWRDTAVRMYEADKQNTFKTMPNLVNGTITSTNLCTSSSAACSVLDPYTQGRYKWYFRSSSSPYMVACNDPSDCVQGMVSYQFYANTWKLKTTGSDTQWWGGYNVRTAGACADPADFAYLQSVLSGLICAYSLQYNWLPPGSSVAAPFGVYGDDESAFLRYIALLPLPIACPGATKYPAWRACDPRFEADVISAASLARMVDQVYFWGSQRDGYRGMVYTPVVTSDVISAIGNQLVKVSSLAEATASPIEDAPTPPASSPGVGVDLGPNPGIQPPALDDVSASSILAPIWDLFPSLRAFDPSYSVQCPVFTPSLLGGSLRVDFHCTLAEGNRAALGALAIVAWALYALLVVLRA